MFARCGLLATVFALLCASAFAADYRALFEEFKKRYNKRYLTKQEEGKRFSIFVQNQKIAALRHLENPLATFGMNIFADMSAEEFKIRHSSEKFYNKMRMIPRPMHSRVSVAIRAGTPAAIDWRTKGAVTGVKDQGQCGSCYTFSTTGNIEGQWFLAGNPLTSLSEQELVSCDIIDDGCNGGFQDDCFEWLFFARNGTIGTEASYPYVSGNGVVPKCQTAGVAPGARISAYADIARDETVMAEHCAANGPVAISLDATSFQLYSGGILTNCVNQSIDHAVLIVGYDNNNSPPYWIVKNSWGQSWGESGYIRIEKGTNQCLLNNMPTSSIVSKGTLPPTPTQTPTNPVTSTSAPTTTTAAPVTTTPTSPPSPPTPSPTTPANTFQQKVCQNSDCTDCQTQTLAQNVCLKTDEGNSAIATCISGGLQVKSYLFSADCTGPELTEVDPTNQCNFGDDGNFIEFICPGGSHSGSGSSGSSSGSSSGHGKSVSKVLVRRHNFPRRVL